MSFWSYALICLTLLASVLTSTVNIEVASIHDRSRRHSRNKTYLEIGQSSGSKSYEGPSNVSDLNFDISGKAKKKWSRPNPLRERKAKLGLHREKVMPPEFNIMDVPEEWKYMSKTQRSDERRRILGYRRREMFPEGLHQISGKVLIMMKRLREENQSMTRREALIRASDHYQCTLRKDALSVLREDELRTKAKIKSDKRNGASGREYDGNHILESSWVGLDMLSDMVSQQERYNIDLNRSP